MTDTKAKTNASIQQLQKLYENLSETDRERLAQAGVQIPLGDLGAISTGEHKWGLRCTKCNKVALYFIGTEWFSGDQKVDVPPALPDIAWTQHLHPNDIDRHTPRCQHCGVTLPRNGSGAFDFGNVLEGSPSGRSKLILVADFQRSKDIAFSKAHTRDFKRAQNSRTVDMGDISHTYNEQHVKASAAIDAKHGAGTSQMIEQAAQATGAAEFVAKGHGV